MNEQELEKLRFPVGRMATPKEIDQEMIENWIHTLAEFPNTLDKKVASLSSQELSYVYRPEGWNIKQLVHHCADSHMNSLIRFKLALTEDVPTIRPYMESRWAELIDGQDDDIESSLNILKGVHHKLAVVLRSLNEEELNREFIHPEHGKKFSLKENIYVYAWHCEHHFAHIQLALEFKEKYC